MTDSAPPAPCPDCLKPADLCVCAGIAPIDNRVFVLILQHPQEQDRDLGTARLALRHFRHGKLSVGLSWPNLAKAAGRPADPKRWAALYLGPIQAGPAPDRVMALDRKGHPLADQGGALAGLDGIILLDGSWSQAKALWWRNAWLLKLRRVALNPPTPSLYGKLRKEPRRDSVSTLEATAMMMARLEDRPDLETAMLASFRALLNAYRERAATSV